jgi:hypothetical protein
MVFGLRNLYWLDRPYVRATEPLFPLGEPGRVTIARMKRYNVRYVATVAGVPPAEIAAHSRQIAEIPVQVVTSRTLGRLARQPETMRVYAWCGAATAPPPCG